MLVDSCQHLLHVQCPLPRGRYLLRSPVQLGDSSVRHQHWLHLLLVVRGGSKADSWWWSILAGRCLSPGWETTPEAIRVKNKAAAVWPAPVPASAERLASSPPPLLAQAEIFQPGPLAVKELQILYDIHPNKLDGGVLICRLDKCRTTH